MLGGFEVRGERQPVLDVDGNAVALGAFDREVEHPVTLTRQVDGVRWTAAPVLPVTVSYSKGEVATVTHGPARLIGLPLALKGERAMS